MNSLTKAVEVIKQGGIVIFPTDTAFGIGCRIDDEKAVERLFEIRKRPLTQATPVLFDSIERVREFVLPLGSSQGKPFSPDVEGLMKKYWPGALTIVLDCIEKNVPSLVRGGGKTIGVRIPDHEMIQRLILEANVPILGPSANFHGEKTPYKFEALDKELIKLVDFVLEGKTKGESLTSTVVDCTNSPWKIVRQGAVRVIYD
ncbi:MAG: hypothetical protein ACD_37C00313G0001 [uncultured bacterium]|nr:MAG: hypothetical protein ACD_37C00313G0001 [uncultured bacterium]